MWHLPSYKNQKERSQKTEMAEKRHYNQELEEKGPKIQKEIWLKPKRNIKDEEDTKKKI